MMRTTYDTSNPIPDSENPLLSGFVKDAVSVMCAPQAACSIFYFDYVTATDNEFGCVELALQARSLATNIPTKRIVADLPAATNGISYAAHGIDIAAELRSAQVSMARTNIEQDVLQAISAAAAALPQEKNLAHRVLTKWFGLNLEPMVEEHQVPVKIMSMLNRVGVDSRFGPGNFAVVGQIIARVLTDSPLFAQATLPVSDFSDVIKIGDIAGTPIYSSFRLGGTDIIVGRKGRADETGIKLIFGENAEIKMESYDGFDGVKRHSLVFRVATVNLGDTSRIYKRTKIRIGRKPWWEKLLKV